MEKLLTVVIPAYNAEKYITYTLDSLCAGCKDQDLKKKNQSWTGNETESDIRTVSARMSDFQPGMDWSEYLEILIIDDGSRDQTGAIADQYAERYPTVVRVIHKENGGHGSGINCGIQNASGRYMKVVDADDWVDPEALDHLIAALKNCRDDVLVSGFYWRFDNGSGRGKLPFRKKQKFQNHFQGVKYGDFIWIRWNRRPGLHENAWNYLADRDPADKCRFRSMSTAITSMRNTSCIRFRGFETVSFIPDFVYQYRIGREGQSVSPEKMVQEQEKL